MLKIKLKPVGKKGHKSFRIVVNPAKSKLDGRFVADLGFYNPQTKELKIDKVALKDWQKKGAQIAIGVDKLLNPENYKDFAKKKKANRLARRQKGKDQPAAPKATEAPTTAQEPKKEETKNESA